MKVSNRKRYVKAYTDRQGRRRHYFRRKGCDLVALPGEPGSHEFETVYAAALAGVPLHRARSRLTKGYVYAIRVIGFDLVKIGYSNAPKRRLVELESGSGMTGGLDMILSFPAKPAVERQLHARFADQRLFGEWFRLGGPIEQWLEANSCLPGRRLASLHVLDAEAGQ